MKETRGELVTRMRNLRQLITNLEHRVQVINAKFTTSHTDNNKEEPTPNQYYDLLFLLFHDFIGSHE